VCALDGFHVEIETPSGGVLADGGIARVSQRARLPVAETCDIILVTAEGLIFRGSVESKLVGELYHERTEPT
jgi:hypothetical protein